MNDRDALANAVERLDRAPEDPAFVARTLNAIALVPQRPSPRAVLRDRLASAAIGFLLGAAAASLAVALAGSYGQDAIAPGSLASLFTLPTSLPL